MAFNGKQTHQLEREVLSEVWTDLMLDRESQSFTAFGWTACTWVLVAPFQYGFHISALNQLQAVLTCRTTGGIIDTAYGLPTCIPMTDAEFSAVTASFTLGGLLGSLVANILMERYGRKGAIQANAALVTAGAGLMTISASITPLLLGRVLIGVGAGVGICVGPVFIGEIAPSKIRGSVGVLTQLSIVFGILFTQAIGMYFATPKQWRTVILFSAALSFFQLLLSSIVPESPAWLNGKNRASEARKVASRLWGKSLGDFNRTAHADDDSVDPLLNEPSRGADRPAQQASISIIQLVKAHELRKPLMIVSFAMIAQQFSGINAVLYYSNDILSKTLPDFSAFVSLGITVVNAIMTFPPIFLIERVGRKTLLRVSIGGALLSILLVGYGLNAGMRVLSSVAIIAFVASYACGLGPVPFVIISDVSPFHAVSALSSAALSLNWIANFIVGLLFLPLRNLLSSGDPSREGRVFYVFAVALALFSFAFARVYKG